MTCSPIYKEVLDNGGHALIAGTTGSGKSVLLTGLVVSALCQGDKHLFLIDPKKVELAEFKGVKACKGYADTPEQALALLERAERIMANRYEEMQKQGLKSSVRLPLLICIDELADLLTSELAKQIRLAVQRIAQLGRAANVRLIACTQAPNRRIIPAELVLNFTQRIGLRCLTAIESRQIVNIKGCELLARYGECLYLRPGYSVEDWEIQPISDEEKEKQIERWK